MTASVATRARALGRALTSPGSLLVLGFAALYLATFDSAMGSPDELQRFRLAEALARRGPGALVDSGSVSKYPPLQSILAAPLVAWGMSLDGGQAGAWAHRLGLGLSLLACIALIPLFFSAARALGLSTRVAAIATAVFGLTNPVWPYSKRFFSEPLTAALAMGAFTGALVYARQGRRGPLAAGLVCLALLPLNNMVVPLAVGTALAVLFVAERRFRALAPLLAAAALGAALAAGLTVVRLGGLRSGYGSERFTFDVIRGLHGLLFGWGRSVFVFAPVLVLSVLGARAFWRRSRGAALSSWVAFAVCLLVVASWWCWWGGICWGPRLVLPVLPPVALGAASFFEKRAAWRAGAAALVLVAGLYVQLMGVAFKHDYDIYFWMRPDYSDEYKAWFEWEYSTVRRMPRHFKEHPWDISSAFLRRQSAGPSRVEVGGQPVREVEITHRGDALVSHWSISEVFVVLRDGSRLPAGSLGATMTAFNGAAGHALDGDRGTRWTSGRKRLDGMWVRLDFGSVRTDVERVELEHAPHEDDFPNALQARGKGEGEGSWVELEAKAATPALSMHPAFFVLAGLGLGLVGVGVRRGAGGPLPRAGT